jgi:hypothetical protein
MQASQSNDSIPSLKQANDTPFSVNPNQESEIPHQGESPISHSEISPSYEDVTSPEARSEIRNPNPASKGGFFNLKALNLVCISAMTTPKKMGKEPRQVFVVRGQTLGFEALFRDLGGQLYKGAWSFWEDPTQSILERSSERMSFGEVAEYKNTRKLAKSERYAGYAENAQGRAEAAHSRVQSICDRIPMGQPILVGHHSERSARADQKRIHNGMRKVCDEQSKAEYLARQSKSLERDAQASYSLRFVGNRIEEKTAEIAKLKRYINGQYYSYSEPNPNAVSEQYRIELLGRLAVEEEQMSYWISKRAAFGPEIPSPTTLKKGMVVKSWAGWCEVLRVNAKSVTIKCRYPSGNEFTRTMKYHEVKAFKSLEEFNASDSLSSLKGGAL